MVDGQSECDDRLCVILPRVASEGEISPEANSDGGAQPGRRLAARPVSDDSDQTQVDENWNAFLRHAPGKDHSPFSGRPRAVCLCAAAESSSVPTLGGALLELTLANAASFESFALFPCDLSTSRCCVLEVLVKRLPIEAHRSPPRRKHQRTRSGRGCQAAPSLFC